MDTMTIKIRNMKYLLEAISTSQTAREVFNEMVASMFSEGLISLEELLELLITE